MWISNGFALGPKLYDHMQNENSNIENENSLPKNIV